MERLGKIWKDSKRFGKSRKEYEDHEAKKLKRPIRLIDILLREKKSSLTNLQYIWETLAKIERMLGKETQVYFRTKFWLKTYI